MTDITWLTVAIVCLIGMALLDEVRRFLRVNRAKTATFKRGLQQHDKQGNRLVYVRVEVNGEGFLNDSYVDPDPTQYAIALARALAEADKWLHEYPLKVGTKEARQ